MSTQNNLGLYETGTFYPYICDIEAISQGANTIVTTSIDHMFVIGNQVQFFIPKQWGITQLNLLKGFVIDVPASDQITVNIDTSTFNAFVTPSGPAIVDPAQVSPIGDGNSGNLSPGGIPVSPNQVPGAYNVTIL